MERDEDREALPEPPPPGGVLWSISGDIRTVMMLPAALTMQVARPAVGAGVDAYSVFRTDPWGRLERSVESVLRWVYDGEEAAEEGRRLRRLHRSIKGTDAYGRDYHSLMPQHYAWVHATGFPVFRHAMPYLWREITPEQERRLYAEWLRVGRVLGINDRDMPQTIEEFWPYYEKQLAEEAEPTLVVRELTDVTRYLPPPDRGPAPFRLAAKLLWPWLMPRVASLMRFGIIGLMPPEARRALDLEWTEHQERKLRRLGAVTRTVVPLLPARLRFMPRARRARAAHPEIYG
ncbi:oxygenase MpaB family protein [Streptomyces sp. ODS28]|uniref:oxygenase MpaB family protein n=1 Tax=Streptomyces sp. ODS28 TaxID=3136688 RepID=UPI0031E97C18